MKKKSVRPSASARKPSARASLSPAQVANQVTWQLKGSLKNARLAYLRVGTLLCQVRDNKMYEALGFSTLEAYAENRLQLGRTSLYKYIQIRDWVSRFHPEWLLPHPEGFIPELYDVADLMEIETALKGKNVSPKKRAKLLELKDKALAGELKSTELTALGKRPARKVDPLKSFTTGLKAIRRKADGTPGIPAEVIVKLDEALALLKNENAVAHLRLMPPDDLKLA